MIFWFSKFVHLISKIGNSSVWPAVSVVTIHKITLTKEEKNISTLTEQGSTYESCLFQEKWLLCALSAKKLLTSAKRPICATHATNGSSGVSTDTYRNAVKTLLGNANLVPPCIHWATSLCIRQMEPAILPPARPSPSRGSAEGTANLFGFWKKAKKDSKSKITLPASQNVWTVGWLFQSEEHCWITP